MKHVCKSTVRSVNNSDPKPTTGELLLFWMKQCNNKSNQAALTEIRAPATMSTNTSLSKSPRLPRLTPWPGQMNFARTQKVDTFKIFSIEGETKYQLREHSCGLATRPLSNWGCQVSCISCYMSHKSDSPVMPSHLCRDAQNQLRSRKADSSSSTRETTSAASKSWRDASAAIRAVHSLKQQQQLQGLYHHQDGGTPQNQTLLTAGCHTFSPQQE